MTWTTQKSSSPLVEKVSTGQNDRSSFLHLYLQRGLLKSTWQRSRQKANYTFAALWKDGGDDTTSTHQQVKRLRGDRELSHRRYLLSFELFTEERDHTAGIPPRRCSFSLRPSYRDSHSFKAINRRSILAPAFGHTHTLEIESTTLCLQEPECTKDAQFFWLPLTCIGALKRGHDPIL